MVANSVTGVSISLSSSGLVLLGYLNSWWPPTSTEWMWIFILQVTLYCTAMVALRRAGFVTEYKKTHKAPNLPFFSKGLVPLSIDDFI